jgi:hypothetical protein
VFCCQHRIKPPLFTSLYIGPVWSGEVKPRAYTHVTDGTSRSLLILISLNLASAYTALGAPPPPPPPLSSVQFTVGCSGSRLHVCVSAPLAAPGVCPSPSHSDSLRLVITPPTSHPIKVRLTRYNFVPWV